MFSLNLTANITKKATLIESSSYLYLKMLKGRHHVRKRQGIVSTMVSVEDARGSTCVKDREELEMKDYRIVKEQPVNWSSGIFHQPFLNVGILYIMGFKSPINPDTLKSGFQQTFLRHPAFSSLQVVDNKITGKMKWVPTKADIERHVIVPSLDTNTDNPDKLVEDYISSLSATKFDYSKPLWEYHILNIKTSEAKATGVFWIHRSLCDGSSFTSLLLAISRKASDPNSLPSLPKRKKQKQVGRRSLVMLWSMLWSNLVINIWSLVATFLIFKDTGTPFRCLPNAEYAPRRFVYTSVSLDDVKLLKNVMNATITDVGLGITQAALSRYANRRYDESKGTKNGNITSSYENFLKVAVLVDIRPNPGVQVLADMMEKKSKAKWGNFLGVILLPLKIQKLNDPLEYIRQSKATFDQKKNTLESTITYYTCWLIAKLFGTKAVSVLIHTVSPQTSLTFSSVVGPVEEITFFGHPVAYLAPTSYGTTQALIVHLQSYADKITFGLSVDQRNIPNPHQLCDDFVKSLMLMKKAATVKGGCTKNSSNALDNLQ